LQHHAMFQPARSGVVVDVYETIVFVSFVWTDAPFVDNCQA
jgi:hypothetical protein